MHKDCCEMKAIARKHGMFEGTVGDDWFHDNFLPCKGWTPEPKEGNMNSKFYLRWAFAFVMMSLIFGSALWFIGTMTASFGKWHLCWGPHWTEDAKEAFGFLWSVLIIISFVLGYTYAEDMEKY